MPLKSGAAAAQGYFGFPGDFGEATLERARVVNKVQQQVPCFALPACLLHLASACIRDRLNGRLQHHTAHEAIDRREECQHQPPLYEKTTI